MDYGKPGAAGAGVIVLGTFVGAWWLALAAVAVVLVAGLSIRLFWRRGRLPGQP